jgi:hypothetical protein
MHGLDDFIVGMIVITGLVSPGFLVSVLVVRRIAGVPMRWFRAAALSPLASLMFAGSLFLCLHLNAIGESKIVTWESLGWTMIGCWAVLWNLWWAYDSIKQKRSVGPLPNAP